MTVSAAMTAVSVLVAIGSLIIAFLSLSRSKKKDSESESKSEGALASDIGYIKAGVDDLKRENRDTREKNEQRDERITRCEESVRHAHKRIDELTEYHKPHE